jgi:hypothetical protein
VGSVFTERFFTNYLEVKKLFKNFLENKKNANKERRKP